MGGLLIRWHQGTGSESDGRSEMMCLLSVLNAEPVHCYILCCMHCLSGSPSRLLCCQPCTLCRKRSETASQSLPFRRDYDISAFH